MKRKLAITLALSMVLTMTPATVWGGAIEEIGAEPQEAAVGVAIDEAHFPDEEFRNALSEDMYDTDEDGFLDEFEIGELESLTLDGYGVSSLDGIEYLTELQYLNLYNEGVTSLDVSKNSKLTSLYCDACTSLSSIRVGDNIGDITCGFCALTSLDVSRATELTYLDCRNNYISDISNVTGLNSNLEEGESFLFYPQQNTTEKLMGECTITLSEYTYDYTGEAYKPEVTVKYEDETVSPDAYTVTYKDNANLGRAIVVVNANPNSGYVGSKRENFYIAPAGVPTVKSVALGKGEFTIKGTVCDGMNYCVIGCRKKGSKSSFKTDFPSSFDVAADGTFTAKVYPYAFDLKNNINYEWSVKAAFQTPDYYLAEGKTWATTSAGKYPYCKYYTPPKISKVSNSAKKTLTVKWSRNSKVTGYQLRYATESGTSKTIKIKSNKTTSKKITKLKKGTTYYIDMRSYKTSGGKTVYSAWSDLKYKKVTK